MGAGSILCSHGDATLGTYIHDDEENVWNTVATNDPASAEVPKFVSGLAEGYPIQLPNHYASDATDATATWVPLTRKKFTLAFPMNPGKLRQPEIDLYLDGSRPTVSTGDTNDENVLNGHPNRVHTWVYPNGFTGEDIDFVPDHCANLRVTLAQWGSSKWTKLTVVDDNSDGNEEKLLKRCLGDADGVMSNNNKVGFTVDDKNDDQALFNWDYGIESEGTTAFAMDNVLHPHLI